MKSFSFLVRGIIFAMCCLGQGLWAQSGPLQRPIGLSFPPIPIGEALQQIEQGTELRFSYNPLQLPAEYEVAVDDPTQSLGVILEGWLAGISMSYRLIGEQVVIYSPGTKTSSNLYGYVREQGTLEPLPYARISVVGTNQGTIANQYGYFSLKENLPMRVQISHFGHRTQIFDLIPGIKTPFTFLLDPQTFETDSVQIVANPTEEMRQPGGSIIGPDFIRAVPTLLGERDVIKALQYLPGVQRANEGNSGLFVRGGNGDQNLILLDEAPVYNVNHLFGFFSVFNGDAVQSIEFIKGGFPAHYGGRLSSVVSVTTREGSREKWGAQGGIGVTSSRIAVGGPVLGKKGSLLLSARRTYWDLVSRPFLEVGNAQTVPFFFFHDYNAKLSYDLGPRDKLISSVYSSRDRYGVKEILGDDGDVSRTGFAWQNLTATTRWNHIISPQAFMNTSVFVTQYGVNLFNRSRDVTRNTVGKQRIKSGSAMFDLAAKYDLYLYPNAKHQIRAGAIVYQHIFTPNRLRGFRENFNNTTLRFDLDVDERERVYSQEAAIYVEDRWQPGPRWTIEGGVRLSGYLVEGAASWLPEPRLKLQYQLHPQHQLELTGTRMAQYIHQISSSGLALPIDVWIPSTRTILPQESWQVSAAWSQQYPSIGLSIVLEAYYKTMNNVIGYREGGSFFDLDLYNFDLQELDWQRLVVQGNGVSSGLEALATYEREGHRFMFSYTWSRTQYQFVSRNQGRAFAPPFDRRHSLSLLYQYEINERLSLSAGWFFATGNPFPLPLSQTVLSGNDEVRVEGEAAQTYFLFSGLDEFRSPLYHRLDASLKIKGKDKPRRWPWSFYWEVGAYNVYNRLNPSFYLLASEINEATGTERLQLEETSLFIFTPSISFNFQF